jgi:hypothetical protein
MELVATVDLPPHRQSQSTKPRTRPSRLPQRNMRLALPNPVAHRLHSQRVLTLLMNTVLHHLRSLKATTHTTDMAHTTDELAAVAAADVEVHGAAAANLDHLTVLRPSCKT